MDRRDSEASPVVRKPAASAGRAAAVNATGGGDGGAAAPGPGPGDASFDTNMVIILAALFFALLFAVGLNSLARCALRCGGRGAGAGGEGASASASGGASCARGIKKRALRSIPVEVWEGGGAEEGEEEEVCAICLGEFADGEKVRVLPRCGHGFHVPCVDAWLLSRGSCPTCRRPVVVGAGKAKAAKGGASGSEGESRGRPDGDTIAVVIA
ncbi:hypothetical protein HU200_031832 [Digitaria exilis]|uniref:RING-type domain-containing protein n=1 Tax=Digitaria exilis TaxID=1010633 RepID=A0A835C075_9POAL|nr:hypothetical protein HU200_031832 [Digitaria exilis]